jgi:hypothetical protein
MHSRNYGKAIEYDGMGYYTYLPHIFIYHSFDIQPDEKYWSFQAKQGAHKVFDKYNYGVSLLILPFFLISHGIAYIIHSPQNGYSEIYDFGVMLAAVFYFTFGIFFLIKTLSKMYSPLIVIISIIAIYAGTNLYYYTIGEPSYSHIYSFSLFCFFLYLVAGFIKNPSWRKTIFISIVYGLIFLLRPTNAIIILYLLLYDIYDKKDLSARYGWVCGNLSKLSLLPFACIVFYIPQMLYWHSIAGKWIFNAYTGESFIYWKSPMIYPVLFGLRNGMIIYAPIMIFSFAGLIIALFRKKISAFAILMIMLTSTYIIAGWWCYWFGLTFGHRAYVEYFAFMVIPTAYIISIILNQRFWLKSTGLILFALCIVYTMKLTYAYEPWAWDKTNWTWYLLMKVIFKIH